MEEPGPDVTAPPATPAPRGLLVFDLMSADPFSDKAYIARPCQFIMPAGCHVKVWTDLRYSQQALDAINITLNKLKTHGDYQSIELIGFSGGATLALLAATQRQDIISVRTVAGNLMPHFVNKLHSVSSMPLALSPVDMNKHKLTSLPQLHFFGENDPVITPQVFREYQNQFQYTTCIKGKLIKDASHNKGWVSLWPQLLDEPLPLCQLEKT